MLPGSSQGSPCFSFPCDKIQGRAGRVSLSPHDPDEIPGVTVSLRSRWIIQVSAWMSVEPAAVSVTRRNCQRSGSSAVCLRARICFRAETRTRNPVDTDIGECCQWRTAGSLERPWSIPGCPWSIPEASQRVLEHPWNIPGYYQTIPGCPQRIPGWDP